VEVELERLRLPVLELTVVILYSAPLRPQVVVVAAGFKVDHQLEPTVVLVAVETVKRQTTLLGLGIHPQLFRLKEIMAALGLGLVVLPIQEPVVAVEGLAEQVLLLVQQALPVMVEQQAHLQLADQRFITLAVVVVVMKHQALLALVVARQLRLKKVEQEMEETDLEIREPLPLLTPEAVAEADIRLLAQAAAVLSSSS